MQVEPKRESRLATKSGGLEKLEKRRDEVRRSKQFKIVMVVGATVVGLVMLVIFVLNFFVE